VTDPGRPKTNSVVARFEGGWRCRVEAGGFDLVVDEPPGSGGTGTGPMPTEYLLAAMASCYALALNWAAGKRGITLPGLAVTATGTYDGPKFCRLQLTVTCDAPAEQVERLLEPALRVCYVSNTIALSPPIEVALGLAGQAAVEVGEGGGEAGQGGLGHAGADLAGARREVQDAGGHRGRDAQLHHLAHVHPQRGPRVVQGRDLEPAGPPGAHRGQPGGQADRLAQVAAE